MTWSKVWTSSAPVEFATNIGTICEEWSQFLETRGWTFERDPDNNATSWSAIAECDLFSVNGTVTRSRDVFTFTGASLAFRNARGMESIADPLPGNVWHNDSSVNASLEGTWTGWVSDQDTHSLLVISNEAGGVPRIISFYPPKGSWISQAEVTNDVYPSTLLMVHPWMEVSDCFNVYPDTAERTGHVSDYLRDSSQFEGHPNNIPYMIKNYCNWRDAGPNGVTDIAIIMQNDVHKYYSPAGGPSYWGNPKVLKYQDIYYITMHSGGESMLLEVGTTRPW